MARTRGGKRSANKGAKPKSRSRKAPRKRFRWLKLLFGVALTLGVVAGAVLVGGYFYFAAGLPDFHSLEDYRPPQVSRVFAVDGTPIAEHYLERRTVVSRDEIPDSLVQAFLSAEDADFYRHEGLDYLGMLRALYNSARRGRIAGSGSTITQQLIKTLLLTPEQTLARKAKELILARRLETRLTKDEILTLYLNQIYFAHGRYGVGEAARYYFGKSVSDLGVAESAMLAGLVQSPERLTPRRHPEAAKQRRAYVLEQMVRNEYIDSAHAKALEEAPFGLAPPPVDSRLDAAWFADEVKKRVEIALGDDGASRLREGGLRIHTTLDLAQQDAAQRALVGALRAVDSRQGYGRNLPHIRSNDPAVEKWRATRRTKLKGSPPSRGGSTPARIASLVDEGYVLDLGIGEALLPFASVGRFAADGKLRPDWSPGDVVTVSIRGDGPRHPARMHASPSIGPQGAVVIIDPRDRAVRALVGGVSYAASPFNRAIQAKRQPGSAFKPFVWGAALETRKYSPASQVLDAPETWPMGNGKVWQPRNYTKKFEGLMSLRRALAESKNTVAVKLAHDVGVPAVQSFARRAGITSPLVDNLTLALGGAEVTPFELANAYATIAANGLHSEPRFVTSVTGPDGPIDLPLTRVRGPIAPAIDAGAASVLRSLMRSVVTDGTARSLKRIDRPVVGKTGTTNEARDAWFVGMVPEAVCATWIGFDDSRPIGNREGGGRTAAPVALAFFEAVSATGPDWPQPTRGVVTRRVDPQNGLLARPETVGAYDELFLLGTEPTEQTPAAEEIGVDDFMFGGFD